MKKSKKVVVIIVTIIAVIWTALTLYVEAEGRKYAVEFGNEGAALNALIIYDPDPFYNLDQQVCEAVAKVLAENNWHVKVMSVSAAKEQSVTEYNLYVFCANTYNWSPDWAITGYIKKHIVVKDKNVAAITLGAGSTGRSQKVFGKLLKNRGGNLLASTTLWLWRPNNKLRMKESNVKVAVEVAEQFAVKVKDILKAARSI